MLWMGIWVHPYTVALVQVELDFRKNGYGWAQVILLDHGWGSKPTWSASHIHIICIQSVLAPWNVVDGHMGQSLHCYACAGEMDFRKNGYGWAWVMLQYYGWGSKPTWSASHIHIICIQSVLSLGYVVDGDMGPPLHCCSCVRWSWNLAKLGMVEPKRCCKIMVEAPNPHEMHLTSISYVYKVF